MADTNQDVHFVPALIRSDINEWLNGILAGSSNEMDLPEILDWPLQCPACSCEMNFCYPVAGESGQFVCLDCHQQKAGGE